MEIKDPTRFLKPRRVLAGIIIVTVFLEQQKVFFKPKRPSIKKVF
jgi:hypothetical protein|tara:strand:- start:175 stop:309 length:135 start_codon:yes stop_codon:yes gene_type:complete